MPFYTIARSDVGQTLLRAFGRVWSVSDLMGMVLPIDVGKRVYLTDSCVLQVENEEQFRVRRDGRGV